MDSLETRPARTTDQFRGKNHLQTPLGGPILLTLVADSTDPGNGDTLSMPTFEGKTCHKAVQGSYAGLAEFNHNGVTHEGVSCEIEMKTFRRIPFGRDAGGSSPDTNSPNLDSVKTGSVRCKAASAAEREDDYHVC